MPQRDDATTVQLKIRIKEPLRAAIEDDAEARRVTMNAVINDRLEQSFREHGRARDLREALALAFGADVTAVMLAIGLAIRDVVNASPVPPDRKKLLSNALLFDQSVAAIDTVIESVRPAALHDNDEYLLPEEKAGMRAMADAWPRCGRTGVLADHGASGVARTVGFIYPRLAWPRRNRAYASQSQGYLPLTLRNLAKIT